MSKGSGQKISDGEKLFSDRLKSEIQAAGIAHDLNSILATISGYAEMLKEDLPADSSLAEKTEKIISAVTRAKSLTNQVLSSGGPAGEGNMAVNLTDLLEETIGLVSSVLPSGIKIVSDIPMGKIMIFTNPPQLFRVFLNLITNAVHSMEESGGTLSINAELVDGNQIRSLFKKNMVTDDYVLVTFRDTGSGMEASLMQRIFEPFYTTKEGGKGTGLGLYVVQEIVNEMGGEICVSSKENEGSVFDIYLPVIKE